jgi:hypothetical protein
MQFSIRNPNIKFREIRLAILLMFLAQIDGRADRQIIITALFMDFRARLRRFGLFNVPAIRPFRTWLHGCESVGIFSLDDPRTLILPLI